MYRPTQPSFKIRILNGNRVQTNSLKGKRITVSEDGYLDIESCVAYPVTYEEKADSLTTLNFTVDKFADVLLYYFHIGQAISFYGGYYSDNQEEMRHVFSGTVTRIKTNFSDNGTVSFSVECMCNAFTQLGKNTYSFVYPDTNSTRDFARAESLKVEDIIRGIAQENNFEIGNIELPPEASTTIIDKKNVRYQRSISDWKFLSLLVNDFGCNLVVTIENGVEKLNVISRTKEYQKSSEDVGFLFPLYGITNKELLNSDNRVMDNEWQRFKDPAYDRPRILRNVSVDEDVSQADAVTRSAMWFDKETGDYKEVVAKTETDKDGNTVMLFYELDPQKVEWVHKNMPKLADRIRDNGPTSMVWGSPDNPENAAFYYKRINKYEGSQAILDNAFFGITLTATCNQDLNLKSQRPYSVRGILSYRSKDLKTSFYLRGLKHIWDTDGTWTELDFIR